MYVCMLVIKGTHKSARIVIRNFMHIVNEIKHRLLYCICSFEFKDEQGVNTI